MIDKILRVREVCSAIGVCRSALYAMVSAGEFPPPLKISRQLVGWKASTVQSWIDARPTSPAFAGRGGATA